MKNIFYIILVAVAALSFSSCEGYLDKLPENTVPVENVDYSMTENMYMPVSGIYADMRKLAAWSGFGLIAVRGDDTYKGSTATDQIEYQYVADFDYEKITGYWALNDYWGLLYTIVMDANSALIALDNYKEYITSDADMVNYEDYYCEVRTIRAYAYFWITRLWEEAPLVLENRQTIYKNTQEEKYNYIVEELEAVIANDNFPSIAPNERTPNIGGVTKITAQAILAKTHLDQKNYEGTLAAAEAVINSGKMSLYDDFYQLFKIPGKLCSESLLEIQCTDFEQGSGDLISTDNWFTLQGPRGNSAPISGWGFMTPSDEIIAFMEGRGEEVRYTTTFMFCGEYTASGDWVAEGVEGEPTSYAGKAYTPSDQMTEGRTTYGTNNNVRMLRYADILLAAAEAKIMLGQSGDTEINLIRTRAGMASISGATIDDLLDERRAEMAMEWGERFFDLVRNGRAASTLDGFVEGEDEFFPIPSTQIDYNPNLGL